MKVTLFTTGQIEIGIQDKSKDPKILVLADQAARLWATRLALLGIEETSHK